MSCDLWVPRSLPAQHCPNQAVVHVQGWGHVCEWHLAALREFGVAVPR